MLTEDRIIKVNLKGKDSRDTAKKGVCEVEKSIPYFDPEIGYK